MRAYIGGVFTISSHQFNKLIYGFIKFEKLQARNFFFKYKKVLFPWIWGFSDWYEWAIFFG